jgi:hypothetical protein
VCPVGIIAAGFALLKEAVRLASCALDGSFMEQRLQLSMLVITICKLILADCGWEKMWFMS